jgi:hypothetical protein
MYQKGIWKICRLEDRLAYVSHAVEKGIFHLWHTTTIEANYHHFLSICSALKG